jgi:hypothetical protein
MVDFPLSVFVPPSVDGVLSFAFRIRPVIQALTRVSERELLFS